MDVAVAGGAEGVGVGLAGDGGGGLFAEEDALIGGGGVDGGVAGSAEEGSEQQKRRAGVELQAPQGLAPRRGGLS